MSDPAELLRRLALLLGSLILANVVVEAALSALVGNPTQPPFSTPEARFQLAGGLVSRLAEIVVGAGLLTAARWGAPSTSAQRRLGWALIVCSGVVLLPLLLLIPAFLDYGVAGMPDAGRFRFRAQFVRALLFYATIAFTLFGFGGLLLARSRRPPLPADLPA